MKSKWLRLLPQGERRDETLLGPVPEIDKADETQLSRRSGRWWISTLVGGIVTVSLLFSVQRVSRVSLVPVRLLWDSFQLVLVAFALRVVFSILLAVRGRIALSLAKVDVKWGQIFRITCVGHLPNLLIPAGLGGDLVRFAAIERDSQQRPTSIIGALLLDRVFGLVALVLAAGGLLAVTYVENYQPTAFGQEWVGGLGVLAIVAILAGMLIFSRQAWRSWYSPQKFSLALLALGTGIAGHLALFASGAVLFEAIPVSLPWLMRMQALAVVSIIASLPVAIGGHGLREVSLVLLLGPLSLWAQQPVVAPSTEVAAQLALLLFVFHVLSHLTIGSLAWATQFVHPYRRHHLAAWTL